MQKKIILLSGDPNSINSELIYKSWIKIPKSIQKKIILISNFRLLEKQFKKLKYPVRINKIKNINEYDSGKNLKILDIDLQFIKPFQVDQKSASKFVKESLNLAHKLAQNKMVKGIINCAIDKSLLQKNKTGVTEYLASKCNVKKNTEVMMISNPLLNVVPLTTHLDIKDVSKKIDKTTIFNKVLSLDKCFKKIFKKRPKIGILGLNPHNAELRLNSEEKKVIIPTILKLRKKGIRIKGPLISDTVFINDYKNYDVIVGMYHDQVLSPFKTLFKFNAINLTLGLKYLRVSPDHGTATNLIGKNKANPLSLLKCINFINKFGR